MLYTYKESLFEAVGMDYLLKFKKQNETTLSKRKVFLKTKPIHHKIITVPIYAKVICTASKKIDI